ncbi:MAG: helix-turn-helix domain-containing protein [Deltaproteobacteria bacterium]
MGRPVDHAKRHQLARRAVEILKERGLDLSNQALADALGIKRPTLLYHFPSKQQIVEHALEGLLFEQAQFVIAKMEAEDHPLRQLYAQVRGVHAFHDGREERIVFLSQAIAAAGIDKSSRFIEIGNLAFEAQRAIMRERLNQAIDDGRMHACDVESLIRLIRSTVDGLMVQRVMTGCDLAPIHEFLWDHVLRPLMRDEEEK